MRKDHRIALLASVVAIVASCGGTTEEPTPGTETSASEAKAERVTLTFSSTGCAHDGPESARPGLVDFEVVNQAGEDIHVDVWAMDDGYTFAEFSAHVDEERGRIENGIAPVGAPEAVTLLTSIEVAGGATGTETVSVSEGTLGFACVSFDGEQGTIHPAGPLEVTT